MNHGIQDDDFSCGIITANTIECAARDFVPLWTPAHASQVRMDWFLRIARDKNGFSWVSVQQ